MERIILTSDNIKTIDFSRNQNLQIDGGFDGVLELNNGNFDLFINSVGCNKTFNINIGKDSNVKIAIFSKNEVKNLILNINCYSNTNLEIYYADFGKNENLVKANIMLLEEGARAIWHLSSLTSIQDKKEFDISIIHKYKNTYGKVENFGVCKDKGQLLFSGTSSIEKGSIQSKTYQNAKIMVFDADSIAIAKPILKIDENDIEANHAAVVGKINDEHLFYLMSRGLSESKAKEIITFGYLKPILEGFVEDNVKDEILSLIEGRM